MSNTETQTQTAEDQERVEEAKILAKHARKYGPRHLFTFIPEGTCVMTTMKGGSKPEFLMAYEDHHFDEDWNVVQTFDVEKLSNGREVRKPWKWSDPRWKERGIRIPSLIETGLRKWPGIYWVGVPPRLVAEQKRSWKEWVDNESGEEKVLRVRRNELTRFFFIKQFPYAFRRVKVETSEGFKMDCEFTLVIEGTNPHTALVKNDDWFEVQESLANRKLRDYVGMRGFLELLSEDPRAIARFKKRFEGVEGFDKLLAKSQENAEALPKFTDFMTEMSDPNIGINNGGVSNTTTQKLVGQKVIMGNIESIDLTPGQKGIEEAVTALCRELLEGQGRVAKASFNATAKRVEGKADADVINLRTRAHRRRFTRVDSDYLKVGGNNALLARIAADANVDQADKVRQGMTAQADAIKENDGVASVVFSGGNALPTVAVNTDKDKEPPKK